MLELYNEFFAMLRFAKNICDCGMEEQLKDWFGYCPLDGDMYWELAYETIGWVFRDTRHYYNDRNEVETWLFMDPVIDRVCQLCQEYEARKRISEEANPFRRDMKRTVHEAFCFDSYSYGYDWRLSSSGHGRKRLLLFTGCEFYSHDEIFEGLMEIEYGFEKNIKKLESELFKETRIIPLSLVTAAQWKEAA